MKALVAQIVRSFRIASAAVLAACGAWAALAPIDAAARWSDFIPRPWDNNAFIDTFTSYERDSSKGSRDVEWSDTFLRERLTLQSIGYSYHPRFMQYQLSLSGLATQEDYEVSDTASYGWKTGTGVEYDTKLSFLPEHPYNLFLFASRYEPVYKEQAATSHSTVADTYGTTVRYRKKPYFFNTTYVDTTLDSDLSNSHTQRLGMNAEYFKRFLGGTELIFVGAYNPSWYDDSNGLDGTADEYLFSNSIHYRFLRLFSSVADNKFDQQDRTSSFNSDQFTWYELMSLYLPWNFRSDLSYRMSDNSSDVDYPDQPPNSFSDNDDRWEFDIVHRLFDSLDTNYILLSDSRESDTGSSDMLSNLLSMNYTKAIPYGRLNTGWSYSHTTTENKGFADVVDEPHSTQPVPGSFALGQPNVDPSTIVVFLRSPIPPNETIRLVENVHYRVVPFLNTYEIQILSLPAEFVVPGSYDFFVSYSLLGGDFELASDTYGTNISFDMFDDLLTPYFNYVGVRSDVVSGEFPGEPVDSDTYTTGLIIHHGPWRARGEYQNVDWQVNPYWSYRWELQFIGALTHSVSVYSTLSYLSRHYEGGEPPFDSPSYTEDTVTASGNIQKQIFMRNMYLSLGGSYSHLNGQVETDSWATNGSLVWTVGKLTISAGVTAYGSSSTGFTIYETDRDHELIYLSLKRQLM